MDDGIGALTKHGRSSGRSAPSTVAETLASIEGRAHKSICSYHSRHLRICIRYVLYGVHP